ncbi:acyltransferase family protein [Phreatobacter sp. HK31-P]
METPAIAAAGRPAAAPPASERARLLDIDTAKGIGIVLVVVGHVVSQQAPVGHDWYQHLKTAIYLFHMPFFMYLSGYVLGYAGFDRREGAGRFIARRVDRLLVPFFAFGLIIIAGKMVFSQIVHVDNTQESLGAYLDGLFVHTMRSPATSVWYLYAAFVYSLLFRFVVVPLPRLLPILIAVGLVLTQVQVESLFYADRVLRHAAFFFIGVWVGQRREVMGEMLDRFGWLIVVAFAALLIAAQWLADPLTGLAVALASIPALHFAATKLAEANDPVFLFFGRYTMAIYLFNTICIGLVKGFGFLVVKWDGNAFYVYFIVLTLAGLFLPVLIRLVVERIAPPLARYIK